MPGRSSQSRRRRKPACTASRRSAHPTLQQTRCCRTKSSAARRSIDRRRRSSSPRLVVAPCPATRGKMLCCEENRHAWSKVPVDRCVRDTRNCHALCCFMHHHSLGRECSSQNGSSHWRRHLRAGHNQNNSSGFEMAVSPVSENWEAETPKGHYYCQSDDWLKRDTNCIKQ